MKLIPDNRGSRNSKQSHCDGRRRVLQQFLDINQLFLCGVYRASPDVDARADVT